MLELKRLYSAAVKSIQITILKSSLYFLFTNADPKSVVSWVECNKLFCITVDPKARSVGFGALVSHAIWNERVVQTARIFVCREHYGSAAAYLLKNLPRWMRMSLSISERKEFASVIQDMLERMHRAHSGCVCSTTKTA